MAVFFAPARVDLFAPPHREAARRPQAPKRGRQHPHAAVRRQKHQQRTRGRVPRHVADGGAGGQRAAQPAAQFGESVFYKQLGHGQDYAYAHNGEDGWVDQDYLGVDQTYYEPTDRGHEAQMKERLEELKRRKSQ